MCATVEGERHNRIAAVAIKMTIRDEKQLGRWKHRASLQSEIPERERFVCWMGCLGLQDLDRAVRQCQERQQSDRE
jgi:hypothetical protein